MKTDIPAAIVNERSQAYIEALPAIDVRAIQTFEQARELIDKHRVNIDIWDEFKRFEARMKAVTSTYDRTAAFSVKPTIFHMADEGKAYPGFYLVFKIRDEWSAQLMIILTMDAKAVIWADQVYQDTSGSSAT